jgi:hypothetical protein
LADLIAGYRQGLGELDERQMALVKSAAMCSVQLERLQAQIIRDEPVDTRLLVRLTNTQTRALQALGEAKERARAQPAGDPGAALRAHLAEIVARRAEKAHQAIELEAGSASASEVK